ncbi:SpaA isopeptide-forming pilin-related protein [Brevibacterium casei]|uniref:SpaA isopeptide-forming pilin-related protein n=1 Tax=Brevibacterium casei TaxID=33889 RepID=UPI00223ACF48|nr:SpaA isopeptide-forming pilin-related protein [Brevibacterium casei]MCT1549684.1 SpaA isopeptide-forming pilin-related protein [Brevibacterium casei]MCT1559221.1 SpaA isopeptide-forming pilin-related protein [Brevibacterium casei]MCT2207649.1 SpaA isopeptide-forming pilin-related protein [Brevibacterium casei]
MSLKRHQLKRSGAALLASSVIASFALLGSGVSPAQAAVTPLPNPPLADKCGLDIGIDLDLSNSLSEEDVDDSKSAAKAIASGLAGTPSKVSVNSFATFGPDGTNEPIPSTSVATSNSVDELNGQIDALQRVPSDSGGTNWDRGLGQLDGSKHDLVLFVTDGKPTAYGIPGTESGNNDRGTRTDQIDIDKAIESSNSLKSQGTKVVGLGVGGGINEDNIKLVSGEEAGDDYFIVSDYSELAEQLREVATKSCQGTLNVTKLIDPSAGEHGDVKEKYLGEGWTISSPDSVDGVEKTTNEDGTVSFKLKAPAEGVQAVETQQAGYKLQQQSGANAVCTANGRDIGTKNIADGFELTDAVGSDETVACQIINEQTPGALSWKKVDENGNDLAGAEFTLTGPDGEDFTVADNGEYDANDAQGQFEVTDLAWGDYTLKETSAPDGYELSDETQTVTITGEKLEVSFSDVVNEKDDTGVADPDGNDDASADPDDNADASTDPSGEDTASADDQGNEDVNAAASSSTSANADDNANPAAQAAADEDGNDSVSAAADENAEANASSDSDDDSSSESSTDSTSEKNASAQQAANVAANADSSDSTNTDSQASADADPKAAASSSASTDSSSEASASSNADDNGANSNSGTAGSDSDDSNAAGSASNASGNSDDNNGGGDLPRTGSSATAPLIGLGVVLLAAGAVTIYITRRRVAK